MLSSLKPLLRGAFVFLFALQRRFVFWGGLAIHEFAKTERILAEIEGIGLSVLCGALGFLAKNAGEPQG